jgi:hypothetical protein
MRLCQPAKGSRVSLVRATEELRHFWRFNAVVSDDHLSINPPSIRKGSKNFEQASDLTVCMQKEMGSPSPRPSPPGEGESFARVCRDERVGGGAALEIKCKTALAATKWAKGGESNDVSPSPGGEGRGEGERSFATLRKLNCAGLALPAQVGFERLFRLWIT